MSSAAAKPEPQSAGSSTSESPEPAHDVAMALALLAYQELMSFHRLATDARFAQRFSDRLELGRLSTQVFDHVEALSARIIELGGTPGDLLAAADETMSIRKDRTRPSDWHESLMKECVIDGILKDFYRPVLDTLDDTSRKTAAAVLDDTRHLEHVLNRLAEAVEADAQTSARLALWGRKLVAEALTRGRVILTATGVDAVLGPEQVANIVQQATRHHSQRMSRLGLVA